MTRVFSPTENVFNAVTAWLPMATLLSKAQRLSPSLTAEELLLH